MDRTVIKVGGGVLRGARGLRRAAEAIAEASRTLRGLIGGEPRIDPAPPRVSLAAKTLLVLLAVWAAACARPPAEEIPAVRVSGASTLYPIVVMASEELREELRVLAQAGGSTRGFEDTLAGRNDLGAMARELTAEEEAQVQKFMIAWDGVGIVVHAENPLAGLTSDDLRRIYTGQERSWRAFGGPDRDIVVVSKAEGHATLQSFLDHTGLERSEVRSDAIGGDNAQVIRLVANSPDAIGYVSLAEVLQSIDVGMPLRLVALDGVPPSLEAIRGGSYPIRRPLYLIARDAPGEGARKLIGFLTSPAGAEVIARGRYVASSHDTSSQDTSSHEMAAPTHSPGAASGDAPADDTPSDDAASP